MEMTMKLAKQIFSDDHCPKCNGKNIYLDWDEYGWYKYCFQCGYRKDVQSNQRHRLITEFE